MPRADKKSGYINLQDLLMEDADEEPLVTNAFFETDIRRALLDISSQTGIRIIVDNTVQGYISIELNNVPLSECLELMLKPLGYSFNKIGNFYIVGLAIPDNPSFPLLSETKVFKLNYIRAIDIENMVSNYYKDFIKINERLNTITIKASKEIIEKFGEEIKKIDIPSKQIMIEVLVTEIFKETSIDIGIDWDLSTNKENRNIKLKTELNSSTSNSNPLSLEIFRSAIPYKDYTIDALARLYSLLRTGKAKIRANPKVATLEGQEAVFLWGKRNTI